MSYARFNRGSSSVYVFRYVGSNILVCCACRLSPGVSWWENYETSQERSMIDHLERHRSHDLKVPQGAIDRLRRELKPQRYFAVVSNIIASVVGVTSADTWTEKNHYLVEISKSQFDSYGEDPEDKWLQFAEMPNI